ncbi:MAG TPA: glycosyltransferase family 4 protein [Pyrinomonadaceae bacterium]|nr:glycosyltransferase family 4 protein [Pyrinomonadaceae bacterium]
MHRILFVHNGPTHFVQLDLDELRKRYGVTECYLRSRWVNALSIWQQVRTHDLVFGWFASWHTFLPLLFARRLGKPSLLVIGGYDVANMPDIGYGHQRGGVKRWVSQRTMRLANRLVTNSHYSREEAAHNALVPEEQVQPVYHGVTDPFGSLPQGARARIALTVGNVDRSNLRRKGHEPFVRAAALMPEVEFILAGAWQDNAIEYLRSIATANVTFTGWLSDDALWNCYRKAAVYVQPSRHEGFGLSVAEAMLAGCIPVVTKAGALPEVTGDFGVTIAEPEPVLIAHAIAEALTHRNETRVAIRQTILDRFPMDQRAQALDRLIAQLIDNAH